MSASAQYSPQFWIFDNVRPETMQLIKDLGFVGVGFWATDRNREVPGQMQYYFDSPTVERTGWAARGTNRVGLREYAAGAHAVGLKVMANMESLNPYGWKPGRAQWTPEIISGVARDLHNCGADRWFTENFMWTPDLVKALATTCRAIGMEYQEGDDPSYLHTPSQGQCLCHDNEEGKPLGLHPGDSEIGSRFTDLYRQLSMVSMYHYHYARDEQSKSASLMEEGTLAYGFARAWKLPTALVYPVGYNWGELPENWEGILKATVLIRALQFRTRDLMLIGHNEEKARKLDVRGTTQWVRELVAKNAAEKRLLLNVVTHLRQILGPYWRNLATSGDGISSGAFHAGYDLVCSTAPMPEADAYYVYTLGSDSQGTLDLTPEIVQLFQSGKPVFLQIGGSIPSGDALTSNWREVLSRCGINPDASFTEGDLPSAGAYNGVAFKYTGMYTAYQLRAVPRGAIIPRDAVTGTILAAGDGVPLIIGKGRNYLIPANCISWQVMYPISHLLAGCGALASSDVWGIAGENVTALLATHDTELRLVIPRLPSGATIRVTQWNRFHNKTHEETLTYTNSYERAMKQFDLIVIETL